MVNVKRAKVMYTRVYTNQIHQPMEIKPDRTIIPPITFDVVSLPAMPQAFVSLPCRSIRQGIVSYSFLSSSSGNTSKTYSFDMP